MKEHEKEMDLDVITLDFELLSIVLILWFAMWIAVWSLLKDSKHSEIIELENKELELEQQKFKFEKSKMKKSKKK